MANQITNQQLHAQNEQMQQQLQDLTTAVNDLA